ncbi:hypothetical protein [Lichenibacterium dinghuense]|uniref:hypothetical protein n=1 Tax=Lichenibacterium dinghuense TaxID=2895977 RepID=UPI001F17EE78|nr:hypothetical protein [Lichenibacterium sp. 6Y81]
MTFRFAAALSVALATNAAWAAPAPNWSIATGVVKVGTLDAGIGEYTFMTRSPVGSKIFAVCKMDDLCEAQVRTNAKGVVVGVGRVRKVEPFTTPKSLLDFIYAHYTEISLPGFNPDEDTASRIYAPALANLVESANIKAGQEQEESPAVSPWLNAQEWKVENLKYDVVDLGPGKARVGVSLTNEGIADAYSFVMVRGDAGWLIADVTSKSPTLPGAPPLTSSLKDYLKPAKAPVGAPSKMTEPSVVANAAAGTVPRLSKGTHYSQAREQLMALGYKGVKTPGADTCDASSDTTCFPEMESCAGTGEGNCLYSWEKDGTFVEVSTVGDPPEVVSVSRGHKPAP